MQKILNEIKYINILKCIRLINVKRYYEGNLYNKYLEILRILIPYITYMGTLDFAIKQTIHACCHHRNSDTLFHF